MPTEAKRAKVAALAEELARSSTSIATDYRGLSVADVAAIRRSLRQHGVTYRIVKNRLAKIAASQAGYEEFAPLFEGPTALALGTGDVSAVARALLDATRPFRIVKVRGAVIGRRRIDSDGVTRLASLPPREVLLGQLAGAMAAPLSTMAGLLNAPLRNLAYALQQVADQRAAVSEA
jgi:large subunit ribosomal protein L10